MSSPYDHDEAEIEASRAPLLDHLVELRSRLIVCVLAMAIGFAICFGFSKQIYMFLLHPFAIAAQLLAAEQAAHAQQAGGFDILKFLSGTKDLFLALIGAREVPDAAGAEKLKLVFTAPLEFFFTKLKLAGFGAVVLTFPVLAWQVYGFVAPGLYKRERKAFLPFLLASPSLFLMGAALVYYVILPFVLWFSLSQQIVGDAGVTVELLPKVSDYLSLVTTLLLAFGLCFQLPVVLTFPVLAWQVYGFVAPGLYKRERKAFLPFLVASPSLFLMGAALVYYVILPFVLWFSLSQQIVGDAGVTVELLPKVSDYLSLVTTLLLAFGLCFQLPVVLTLLGMAGLISSKALSSGRRYAIVGVFVVAAVVTPPDPISQTMLAVPIILLYEISIWCVKLIEIRRKREEDEAGTDVAVV